MATTYTLISSNTLSSSAASVTFSSIPSTYTDLCIKMSVRAGTAGALGSGVYLTLNSDTSSLYSITRLEALGSTAQSTRATGVNTQFIVVDFLDTAGNTANTFTSSDIYIPNYTSTTSKPMGIFNASENNATTATSAIESNAGLYRNTSALTTIAIQSNGSNFVSGSSFYLYGISKS